MRTIAGHLNLSREDTAVGAAEIAVEYFRPDEDQLGRINQEPHHPHSGSLLKTAMSQSKAPRAKFRHDFRHTLRETRLEAMPCNPGGRSLSGFSDGDKVSPVCAVRRLLISQSPERCNVSFGALGKLDSRMSRAAGQGPRHL